MRKVTPLLVIFLPGILQAECTNIELSLNFRYLDISIFEETDCITKDRLRIERYGVVKDIKCTNNGLSNCEVAYSFELSFIKEPSKIENTLIAYCSTFIQKIPETGLSRLGVGESSAFNLSAGEKYQLHCSGGGRFDIEVAEKSFNSEASKAGAG